MRQRWTKEIDGQSGDGRDMFKIRQIGVDPYQGARAQSDAGGVGRVGQHFCKALFSDWLALPCEPGRWPFADNGDRFIPVGD